MRSCGDRGYKTKAGAPCGYKIADGAESCPHHDPNGSRARLFQAKGTAAAQLRQLPAQLEGMDLRKILDDLSQIATSARNLVASPELKQGMKDFAATAGHARKLAAQLEQRAVPLTRGAERAMASVDRAGDKIGSAADKLGTGADKASTLLDANGPVVPDLRKTLAELQRASSQLREAADGDGPLLQQTEKTMRDLSQAAKALRQLATSLEAQPEALLRGRKPDPAPAALPTTAREPAR